MIAALLAALLAAAPKPPAPGPTGCKLQLSGARSEKLDAPGAISVSGFAAAHDDLRKLAASHKAAPLETMAGDPGQRTLLVSCQTANDNLRLRVLQERGKPAFMVFLKIDGGIYVLGKPGTLAITRSDGTAVAGTFSLQASPLAGSASASIAIAGSFSFPCPAASHQCEEHR